MTKRIAWPPRYTWLHEYALAKQDAVLEHKESWNANLYRVHGRIFALLLHSPKLGTLLNLKCEPYLAMIFRERHPTVLPGWHMNKVHWISLSLKGNTPADVCRELVDISHELVWQGLPRKIRETAPGRIGAASHLTAATPHGASSRTDPQAHVAE